MAGFPLLRENLAQKTLALDEAEARLTDLPAEPAAWLAERLADRDFALFCGAGISVAPPASAPQFVELRNAVVLALVDLLVDRGVLGEPDQAVVERAIEALETRADLELPPEHVFGLVSDALGFELVSHLLRSSLDGGEPNENHHAIARMARMRRPTLAGVITPNFDLYLERALGKIGLRRTVAGAVDGFGGFPVSKPHGSLDRSDSIALDVEGVARPLKGVAREAFRELVTDRIVVVIGYSGWDYDLFPLLIHSGREWNTEVVWVLFDDASMNERVAKIQLALGERCTVLNGRRRALLPLLAGGVEKPADAVRRDHRAAFGRILAAAGDDALAEALVGLLTPSGVDESEGVVRRLCHELLRLAESNRIGDDDVLLRRLGVVVGWSESEPDIRRRAAELAVATALRLQREPAVRSFRRLLAGDDDDASVEGELRWVERDLRDFPFAVDNDPNPTLARWSIMTDLRIREADLLLHAGRGAEAETLAARILKDTRFPSSGVSEDAWIVTDGYAPWKLHAILAIAAAERGDDDTVEAHFCKALDLLWRELEFWDLDEALRWVGHASRRRDRECGAAALGFAVRVARFSQKPYSELHALERKLEYGVGTAVDLERAEELLRTARFGKKDEQRHREALRWLGRRTE